MSPSLAEESWYLRATTDLHYLPYSTSFWFLTEWHPKTTKMMCQDTIYQMNKCQREVFSTSSIFTRKWIATWRKKVIDTREMSIRDFRKADLGAHSWRRSSKSVTYFWGVMNWHRKQLQAEDTSHTSSVHVSIPILWACHPGPTLSAKVAPSCACSSFYPTNTTTVQILEIWENCLCILANIFQNTMSFEIKQ